MIKERKIWLTKFETTYRTMQRFHKYLSPPQQYASEEDQKKQGDRMKELYSKKYLDNGGKIMEHVTLPTSGAKPITIIAEGGINHNGSIETALKMMDMAKDCGCDYIKWQKRDIYTVYTKEFLGSPRESPWGNTQEKQKLGLEFREHDYDKIDGYSKIIGLPWFASAWDIKSLEFLDKYNLPHNKIASAMITNYGFLNSVAERGIHAYISTGMATMNNIEDALDIFARHNCQYTLFHCVAKYPCEDSETNLLMIKRLIERFGTPVGYSSHDVGVGPSIISVVLGATVIEKHITLDRVAYGSDQASSMEKKGLEYLVKECRNVTNCLGNGRKNISSDEKFVASKLRYWEGIHNDKTVSDTQKRYLHLQRIWAQDSSNKRF